MNVIQVKDFREAQELIDLVSIDDSEIRTQLLQILEEKPQNSRNDELRVNESPTQK